MSSKKIPYICGEIAAPGCASSTEITTGASCANEKLTEQARIRAARAKVILGRMGSRRLYDFARRQASKQPPAFNSRPMPCLRSSQQNHRCHPERTGPQTYFSLGVVSRRI